MRVVVLCGGSGSRLWPESRESLPKQFIPIFNGKSLLDLTIERVLSLNFTNKPILISNKKHGFLVQKALAKYSLEADIFLEPEGKNTCAAIYLAAKHCSYNEQLLIMPSDHLIPNDKIFAEHIFKIQKFLPLDNWITLGIKPTKPSEAYGYIKINKNKEMKLCEVVEFIEKPSKNHAKEFIQSDSYFWNAGIFIVNASKALKSINKYASDIAYCCDQVFSKIYITKSTNEYNFPPSLFTQIPSQSIDYAVMEHDKDICLYPFNSAWSDVGSWDAISEIFKDNPLDDNIVQINSYNNFIKSDKRTIATIGVNDLIIIDSDNATLISKKNQSEKVKLVVNKLLKNKSVSVKENSFEIKPWGKFENLFNDKNCKVKRLIVSSNKRLSLQYHNFRSEHWLVVHGIANVHVDNKNFIIKPGQSIDIPLKSHHYVENKQNEDLIIIETQLGSYFGEDDIIRLDDPHGR